MRILISGYYGFGNLGDELILGSIVSMLRARYKFPEITILSADPENTADHHHVNAVSRWNPLIIFLELWRNDFLILGGGGLLQNKTSNRSLLYYLGLIALARLSQCPVVLFAMGVESIDGKISRWLTKLALNGKDVTITVRDQASKEILANIGVDPAKIHVTADPVFSRTGDSSPRERYASQGSSALLVPRFPCPSTGRRVFAIAGRILREEKKMKVQGVLFQPQTESAYLQFFNGESILNEQDFLSGLTSEAIASEVGKFDFVISARFHGLVLAAINGKPFIGVGDPQKVGRLCQALKMPYLPWDATEEQIANSIEKISLKHGEGALPAVEQFRQAALQTTNHVG